MGPDEDELSLSAAVSSATLLPACAYSAYSIIVNIMPVIDEAVRQAGVTLKDIDQVAVTYGPGLVGALLVGVSAAKALAFALDKPLIGVNHLEGHIFANFLAEPTLEPPFMALVVSGGHTALVDVRGYDSFHMMGQTRDDAAGEAFDKIARVMGLPYPGGPRIDALAKEGDPLAIDFPRALEEKGNYEFSFSGLKSAVLNYINSEKMKGHELRKADIAASFQHSVVEVLVEKAFDAVRRAGRDTLVLAGGVAANGRLRQLVNDGAQKLGDKGLFARAEILRRQRRDDRRAGVLRVSGRQFSRLEPERPADAAD